MSGASREKISVAAPRHIENRFTSESATEAITAAHRATARFSTATITAVTTTVAFIDAAIDLKTVMMSPIPADLATIDGANKATGIR